MQADKEHTNPKIALGYLMKMKIRKYTEFQKASEN